MCWHTMPTAHYDNALWVPMPIIHPKNWLLVVENSRLFAQRTVRPRMLPKKKINTFFLVPLDIWRDSATIQGDWG